MSSGTLQISVASPAAEVLNTEARKVTVETQMGQVTILPSHVSYVASLGAGPLIVESPNGQVTRLFVAGGFVEVFEDRISVLADAIELAKEIDEGRARTALGRAAERLQGSADGKIDIERAIVSGRRAEARLEFRSHPNP